MLTSLLVLIWGRTGEEASLRPALCCRDQEPAPHPAAHARKGPLQVRRTRMQTIGA